MTKTAGVCPAVGMGAERFTKYENGFADKEYRQDALRELAGQRSLTVQTLGERKKEIELLKQYAVPEVHRREAAAFV